MIHITPNPNKGDSDYFLLLGHGKMADSPIR